jgi:predicted short-subunit dehydrogenase-like oxidoreductase (DUF2520 family)
MKIVLLGSGNVATHLGKALKQAGHDIIEVWSRTFSNAQVLATALKADPIQNISELSLNGDVYILCVSDDSIKDVASSSRLQNKLLVHTSGSTSLEILSEFSPECGVLYPLQTFSKSKAIDFDEIPLIIEASTPEVQETLGQLALSLSQKIYFLDFKKRQILHMAAVFACNFVNYLYSVAEELLDRNMLDFDMIRPLIAETAEKIQTHPPQEAQTGPAKRNDVKILSAHLNLLKDDPQFYELYELLSQRIVNLNPLP